MKYFLTFTVIMFFFLRPVYSQIEKGDHELSIGASYMSRSYENSDESWTAFNFPVRYGFFVTRIFQIEPELLYSKYKDNDTGLIFSCNLAFNMNASASPAHNIPFLYAGMGYSNTVIFFPNFANAGVQDKNWTILNLGAGLKMFLTESVALRFEYRFQKFYGDTDMTFHTILLGFSVFI